ncbi:MAG: SMP-30/gluconolactonase/LRE family protein [Saprospiraceae bacterium]|nr:SMP-30/gluconolactonase/LRE family protein [Saprospiraceae bacterium]
MQGKNLKRRDFLSMAGALGILPYEQLLTQETPGENISDAYDGLKTRRYLGKVKIATEVSGQQIFLEGPAVDVHGQVFFTNIPANEILLWDPVAKKLSVALGSSNGANGLRFRPNGKLLVCEGGSGLISEIDLATDERTVLADGYAGKSLQSTNDLEYDREGRIYFSSRAGKPDLSKQNVKGLYRVDPDGSVIQLLAEPDVQMPNGVVLSPDEKTLYMIEAHPGDDHNRCILAFDLAEDGALINRRTLIDFYPGRSGDGMCIDANGNLYVAAGLHALRNESETLDTRPGIHVISPEGKLLAFRETPEDTITNCTFGGKDLRTLYITCGKYLLSLRTKIPGKSSYRPSI